MVGLASFRAQYSKLELKILLLVSPLKNHQCGNLRAATACFFIIEAFQQNLKMWTTGGVIGRNLSWQSDDDRRGVSWEKRETKNEGVVLFLLPPDFFRASVEESCSNSDLYNSSEKLHCKGNGVDPRGLSKSSEVKF